MSLNTVAPPSFTAFFSSSRRFLHSHSAPHRRRHLVAPGQGSFDCRRSRAVCHGRPKPSDYRPSATWASRSKMGCSSPSSACCPTSNSGGVSLNQRWRATSPTLALRRSVFLIDPAILPVVRLLEDGRCSTKRGIGSTKGWFWEARHRRSHVHRRLRLHQVGDPTNCSLPHWARQEGGPVGGPVDCSSVECLLKRRRTTG